jgi:hypothetical protein
MLVLVEAEGRRVALEVGELVGQQQVVVKNLESNYRKVPGVSGATIMGDGSVALILDVESRCGAPVRCTSMCPPCSSTDFFTMARPSPVPWMRHIAGTVEGFEQVGHFLRRDADALVLHLKHRVRRLLKCERPPGRRR